MEKIIKNERGITLVALVITIIILLILAGITITNLTNSELFKKSQIAKEKYKNAQTSENYILSQYENKIVGIRDNLENSSYKITKIGEQTGTSPINVDISLYDSFYIKVTESKVRRKFYLLYSYL